MKKPGDASIDRVLSSRKVLITCGTGGVGKTTLSAALAFRAALLGRKTVVVTIDPAKRLKTSLGLSMKDELGDQPTSITERLAQVCRKLHDPALGFQARLLGTLDAVVPDTRRTFERFVAELAPRPEVADRILQNPIFEIFARDFSGSNEYMALERLLSLHSSGKYDLIVLDTPPSRNTLHFLHAPQLLSQFFEERLIRWLVKPANRIVSASMRTAITLLGRLTGEGFMTKLLDFAASIFEMQENFQANLKRVSSILASAETGFLMVTAPTPDTVLEIRHFIETLRDFKFQLDGVAINRTLSYLEASDFPSEEAERLLLALQKRERKVLEELETESFPLAARLPELARDVHSVEDLFHVAMAFGPNSLA